MCKREHIRIFTLYILKLNERERAQLKRIRSKRTNFYRVALWCVSCLKLNSSSLHTTRSLSLCIYIVETVRCEAPSVNFLYTLCNLNVINDANNCVFYYL